MAFDIGQHTDRASEIAPDTLATLPGLERRRIVSTAMATFGVIRS
jgi:hypothetical protein